MSGYKNKMQAYMRMQLFLTTESQKAKISDAKEKGNEDAAADLTRGLRHVLLMLGQRDRVGEK
jgi:hypothetical protein